MLYKDMVQIMRLRNRKRILKEVRKFGYKNTAKNKHFKKFPLAALFSASEDAYGWISTIDGTRVFKGSLFTEVEGAEQFEFFVLQTNYCTNKKKFKRYHLDILHKEIGYD